MMRSGKRWSSLRNYRRKPKGKLDDLGAWLRARRQHEAREWLLGNGRGHGGKPRGAGVG